ncbi:MAG: CHAP domain-containing protein, partial [Candidatus Nanoperiomorbaceae bacterium]
QLLDQSKGSQTAAATKITSLQNNNTQLKQKQKETNAAALAAAVQKAASQNPTQPVAGSNPDPGAGSARQVSHSPAIGISQNSQCGGGYPYCGSAQDSMVDPWGLYNRECVSYAAYKVNSTYGNMPYMGGHGNASQWPGYLAGRVPEGPTPKVGSVAIMNIGYYGHAAWVEAVNGGWVTVSQYNWDEAGHYSTMTVPASLFSVYIYF